MLNRVVLVGRMTRDPELRRTANGTPVASFTLAMNRNFSSQNGERQADFIPCVGIKPLKIRQNIVQKAHWLEWMDVYSPEAIRTRTGAE